MKLYSLSITYFNLILKSIFECALNLLEQTNRYIVLLGFKPVRTKLNITSFVCPLNQTDFKILETLITQ